MKGCSPHSLKGVFSSALTSANSKTIIELAARYRLPAVYPFKSFTESAARETKKREPQMSPYIAAGYRQHFWKFLAKAVGKVVPGEEY